MRLSGKTALVTRGTTGIGFATVKRFLADGIESLVITGVDQGRRADAARELGPAVTPIRADARSLPDLDRLAAEMGRALGGRLDVLFANAGVGSFAPIEQAVELLRRQIRRQRERAVLHRTEADPADGRGR